MEAVKPGQRRWFKRWEMRGLARFPTPQEKSQGFQAVSDYAEPVQVRVVKRLHGAEGWLCVREDLELRPELTREEKQLVLSDEQLVRQSTVTFGI